MFISELARNAKALNPLKLLKESVEENDSYIVDLNTSQLSKGKDSKGESLAPYANPDYAQLKMSMGSQAPLGTPNLKFEGNFYEGFNLKADEEGFNISSTDSKSEKLKSGYGRDIFGLTDESRKDLKTVLLPTFLNKIRNELFKS
jgi:hypothetical protein